MIKKFQAHSSIPVPAVLNRFNFADESWKNDACASAWLTLANGVIIQVWIDYPDPDERDMEQARFAITIKPNEEEQAFDVANFEDESEFEACLIKLISCFNIGGK